MTTAKIIFSWHDRDEIEGIFDFTMDFHTLPRVGDGIVVPEAIGTRIRESIKDFIFGGNIQVNSFCYVRRFINDGGETPIIRMGIDPAKLFVKVRPDYSEVKYSTVFLILAPGRLPRPGDSIWVVSKTKSGESFANTLYVKTVCHDSVWPEIITSSTSPSTEVHVLNTVNAKVVNTVDTKTAQTLNTNVINTVNAKIAHTLNTNVLNAVAVEAGQVLPVEVVSRYPLDVNVTNSYIPVSGLGPDR